MQIEKQFREGNYGPNDGREHESLLITKACIELTLSKEAPHNLSHYGYQAPNDSAVDQEDLHRGRGGFRGARGDRGGNPRGNYRGGEFRVELRGRPRGEFRGGRGGDRIFEERPQN